MHIGIPIIIVPRCRRVRLLYNELRRSFKSKCRSVLRGRELNPLRKLMGLPGKDRSRTLPRYVVYGIANDCQSNGLMT